VSQDKHQAGLRLETGTVEDLSKLVSVSSSNQCPTSQAYSRHVDNLAVMDETRNRITKLEEKFIETVNKLRQEQAINISTSREHKLKATTEQKRNRLKRKKGANSITY
jgi:hypothetical protein